MPFTNNSNKNEPLGINNNPLTNNLFFDRNEEKDNIIPPIFEFRVINATTQEIRIINQDTQESRII